jgi:type VI secretion system protein ImpF
MLLNARRRFRSWPASMGELDTSPLGFGIPDCTAGTFNDQREREAFRAEVEATIRRFEPRFLSVVVQLPEFESRKLTSSLRLRVEALLHADPAPEAISFDTVVDAVTSNVDIQSFGTT